MEYLKKYNITESQIQSIKDRYNNGIIKFFENNEDFVKEKIEYLEQENFTFLYELLYNNVKIFVEELGFLQYKVEKMKEQNISLKAMNMILMEENLYDRID